MDGFLPYGFVVLLSRGTECRLLTRIDEAHGEHSQCGDAGQEEVVSATQLDEIRQMVVRLGFDAETVQQTTDRHWTWSAKR